MENEVRGDQDVVEEHIRLGIPMPPGTAKLIWIINRLVRERPPDPVRPANIQYFSTSPEQEQNDVE